MDIPPRPRGLVPGSIEWVRAIEGPRIIQRLLDEVHAHPTGEMTPTAARCAGMVLPLVYPTLSSVHVQVENQFSRMTDEELKARFQELIEQKPEVEEARIISETPLQVLEPAPGASPPA